MNSLNASGGNLWKIVWNAFFIIEISIFSSFSHLFFSLPSSMKWQKYSHISTNTLPSTCTKVTPHHTYSQSSNLPHFSAIQNAIKWKCGARKCKIEIWENQIKKTLLFHRQQTFLCFWKFHFFSFNCNLYCVRSIKFSYWWNFTFYRKIVAIICQSI